MNQCMLTFADQPFANLIFLPVMLNGQSSIALFDTGAQISCVRASIASQLGLKHAGEITGGNNQGKQFSYPLCEINTLAMGTFALANQKLGILPDSYFDVGKDEHGRTFPAQVILGWDVISRFCWTFYMADKRVLLEPGGTLPRSEALSWNGFPVVLIRYEGTELLAGFDSGHTETMPDRSWLNLIQRVSPMQTIIQGIGSKQQETVYRIDEFSFRIGNTPIQLADLDIADHEIYGSTEASISVLLGADILTNRTWKMDYQSRCFEIDEEMIEACKHSDKRKEDGANGAHKSNNDL